MGLKISTISSPTKSNWKDVKKLNTNDIPKSSMAPFLPCNLASGLMINVSGGGE
jgi:hypothetical protein